MANNPRIKFKRVNLTEEEVYGHADDYPLKIHYNLKGKKELEIYIHESLHYLFPELSEEEVIEKSIKLTNTLWHESYRKVDNTNKIPLQNGLK